MLIILMFFFGFNFYYVFLWKVIDMIMWLKEYWDWILIIDNLFN